MESQNKLTILMIEPGKTPYSKTIDSGLRSLQQEVGGYIQAVYPFDDPVAIVCCETGKLDQMPFNRGLRDDDGHLYDYIAGNFMIVGLGEEDFTSLSPEYLEKYGKIYEQPEILSFKNGEVQVLPDDSYQEQCSNMPEMEM